MEAHSFRAMALVVAIGLMGASHRSANFVVSAPTPEMAAELSRAAEGYRRDLAIQWLGSPMPNWSAPCPIDAHVAPTLGAGGATSFLFEHGEVYGWQMTIQGSWKRMLDSVLPHEITHTIFATHFRRPLPRWADEGACTTVEHSSERGKQQVMLIDFLRTNRGIPFSQMFVMKDYPRDVLPLYSQGYSLARYLIAQGGRREFMEFLADGMRDDNWSRAVAQHYNYGDLAVLQNTWLDWVRQGSPNVESPASASVASAAISVPAAPAGGSVYGGQGTPAQLTAGMATDSQPLAKLVEREENRPLAIAPRQPAAREIAAGTSSTPAGNNTAASDLGWHAPRRDRVLDAAVFNNSTTAAQTEVTAYPQSSALQTAAAGVAADGPSGGGDPTSYEATRPQPTQRPRQTILEWSRQPAAAAAPTGADVRVATDESTWRR